jgi:hypothetical protein
MRTTRSIQEDKTFQNKSICNWESVNSRISNSTIPERHAGLQAFVLEDVPEMMDDIEAIEDHKLDVIESFPIFLPRVRNSHYYLEEIENEYHGIELMFGDILENELFVEIPKLKELCENNEEKLEYIAALDIKEMDLFRQRLDIQENNKLEETNEAEFISKMKRIIEKNKMKLKRAQENKLDVDQINRIARRIEIGLTQLEKELQESVAESLELHSESRKSSNQVNSYLQASIDIEYLPKGIVSNEDKHKIEDKIAIKDPAINCLISKINYLSAFAKYLETYMMDERENDLKEITHRIKLMKGEIKRIRLNPFSKSIKQIESDFPNLDSRFIIGMDRLNRNKKIDEIISLVRMEMSQIQSATIVEKYKQHYTPIIGKLLQMRDSVYCSLPVMTKSIFQVPTYETNKSISNGELILRICRFQNSPKKRYFHVSYEFKYEAKLIHDGTKYCESNGVFDFEKKYLLDINRLNKNFSNEKITFYLFKKKYLIGSRQISQTTLSLERLNNFKDYKTNLEFEYKQDSKLSLNIEICIHRALENPIKEIELYTIDKQIPEFKYTPDNDISSINEEEDLEISSDNYALENRRTVNNRTIRKESPNAVRDNSKLVNKNLKSSYFSSHQEKDKQKMSLQGSVKQSKYNEPKEMTDVSYFEELINILKTQLYLMNKSQNHEGYNEARNLKKQAKIILNDQNKLLNTEKLGGNELKSQIYKFLLFDEQMLLFFKAINSKNEEDFVKNRMDYLNMQINQLNDTGV